MVYPKLVRDKIPELIKNEGKTLVMRHADDDEYWDCLQEKLVEEVDEFLQNSSLEEIADILEVIDAIKEYKNFNEQEVQRVKEEKAQHKGRFTQRIVIDDVAEVASH